MSTAARHDARWYRSGGHRPLADAVRRLAEALERHRMPRPSASPDHPAGQAPGESAQSRSARQEALLWSVALELDRQRRAGAHAPLTARPTSVTLADVLGRIDAVTAAEATVRAAVDDVRTLLAAAEAPPSQPPAGAGAAPVYLVERLWGAIDAPLRRQRGGYFTPPPLVEFIVRAVDRLLQRELDIPDGLAAGTDALRVIDPACGSGAFLLGVADFLRRRPALQAEDRWARFARDLLVRRLVGIDVLPACCSSAEMLLQLQLGCPWHAHCSNILEDVALAERVVGGCLPVIIGNPPYANFGRRNQGAWIRQQLAAYKSGLVERKHNLGDDFIKFLRWGQYWIDRAGGGILAMVTSHTYLAGITHRVMRASLAESFDQLYLLDLHGNQKKRERTPTGERDENVFDIQTGVAIGLLVKRRAGAPRRAAEVQHAELWGSRSGKLAALAAAELTDIAWQAVPLRAPHFSFTPRSNDDECLYRQWPRLDEIFEEYVSGVQSKCDALFVGFTPAEVEATMRRALDDADGREGLPAWLRPRLADVTLDRGKLRPYMVAPWDVRWIYYDPALLGRARQRVLRQLDGRNLGLIFMRQAAGTEPYDHVLATRVLVSDRVFYSAHGAPFVAPLLREQGAQWVSNLNPLFVQELSQRLGLSWRAAGGSRPDARSFSTRDVFHWLYAALHSPRYRDRFGPLLRLEFPRVPWPRDGAAFRGLVRVGRRLVASHCSVVKGPPTPGGADPATPVTPGAVADGDSAAPAARPAGRAAQHPWRAGIEDAVWQYRIGGYPVLPRWLQQRRGRALSGADRRHFLRMVVAIRRTLQCGAAIDQLVW